MKEYFVIMQDEWNNLYYLGTYPTLDDALPDVNDWLETYECKIDKLEEYPSTFNSCFDREIETPEGEIVMVRGFIFYKEEDNEGI